jgi:hypothetical protein
MSSEKQDFDENECLEFDDIIIVDGPGDTTVRPITGDRRKRAQAEWAKIQYWTAVERGEIDPDKTAPPPAYCP